MIFSDPESYQCPGMLDVTLNLKFCWLLEKREIGGKILSFKEFKLYSFLFSISERTDVAVFTGGMRINKQQSSLMFPSSPFSKILSLQAVLRIRIRDPVLFFYFFGIKDEKNPDPGSGMFIPDIIFENSMKTLSKHGALPFDGKDLRSKTILKLF
jgi:hypothetical protein